MANKNNEFRGYGLFNDVEDKEIQIFNRARTLVNIMDDHSKGDEVNGTGAMICMGYFKSLPGDDRMAVHEKAFQMLEERKAKKNV